MNGQPGYHRGDRVALEHTTDPHTRLQPGDEGTVTSYDPKHGQLNITWDSGSTLAMLPAEGDRVRLLTPAPAHSGTGAAAKAQAEDDTEAGGADARQDITDRASGLSRLLSQRCSTCILRPGDKMHLGPQRTAAFVRHALAQGTYVICHQTLTYGDNPRFGPAICRGFYDAYADQSPALSLLRAFQRLTEIEPPPPQPDAR